MWSVWQSRKMGRRVAGLLGGLLATILLVAAPAAAAFADPINLSNSPLIPSGSPAIAVNGAGRVFVAWKEGSGLNFKILFRRSNATQGTCGGGLKFDEMPVSLWAGPVAPSRPALAANDTLAPLTGLRSTEVFVAWQASSAVWFNRSANDGQAFFDPVPPSPVNLGSSRSALTKEGGNAPSVAADTAGRVFVAWSNGSATPPAEIFLWRSTSSVFESAANVSGTPEVDSRAPSLATDGTNIFLAWEESGPGATGFLNPRILHKKFGQTDALAGVAGMAPTNLSSVLFPTGVGRAFGPNVAFGDDMLSVAFLGGDAVYHRSSSDGTTFSAPENLSGAIQFPSNARGARRNHSAMVAWAEELATVGTDIRYRKPGTTMSSPEPVLETAATRASPAAAIDATGRLLVAWQGREPADLSNGVTADEVYVSYREGTGGGTMMTATVWAPGALNAKTMYPGSGVFRLGIQLAEGKARDIVLNSLRVNGMTVQPVRTSLGDANGDGTLDLELKLQRSDLVSIFGGANGNYTVTVEGSTGGGCFSGSVTVRVLG